MQNDLHHYSALHYPKISSYKKLNRKLFTIISSALILLSFFAIALVNASAISSQTIHMSGVIAYPTSSPTPTPTPTSSYSNLAPLPTGWSYPPYSSKYSYPVTVGGQTAMKILNYGSPYTGANGEVDREIDSNYINISPGDTIVFEAWFWTEASTIGDTSSSHGASIEIDPFNGNTRICGVNLRDNSGIGIPGYTDGYNWAQYVVPWGSGKWVHQKMTWTVPATVQSDGFGNSLPAGTPMVPTGMIAAIFACSSNPGSEGAALYVYGVNLYIIR